MLTQVRKVVTDHPVKSLGAAWALVMIALSPIYGANLAISVQKWGCPKLPWLIADTFHCPEVVARPAANTSAVDPRSELFKEMGIAWSEENFWSAVKRGDERATLLFLRAGAAFAAELKYLALQADPHAEALLAASADRVRATGGEHQIAVSSI
jgi:hypothetical protein